MGCCGSREFSIERNLSSIPEDQRERINAILVSGNRATWPFFTSNLVNSLLTEPDRDSVQQRAELDVPSVLVWSGMLVDIVLIDIWVEGSSCRTTHGIVFLGVNRPSLNFHHTIFKAVIDPELVKNVDHGIQLLFIPDVFGS